MSNVVLNELGRFEEHMALTSLQANARIYAVPSIVDFFISTDSVVAKATLVTRTSAKRIEVQWGDGSSDIINRGSNTPMSAGIFELFHRYDVHYVAGIGTTKIPSAQERVVTLRVDEMDGPAEFAIERIVITPKYSMTLYPLSVWIEESCDHCLIRQHEFHIIQTIEGEVINDWNWSPSNSSFGKTQGLRLEESRIVKEYEIPAVLPFPSINVKFDFTESYWLYDEKNSVTIALPLYHSREDENVIQRFERRSIGGCNINYSFSKVINLLAKLPVEPSAHCRQSELVRTCAGTAQ